MYSDTFDRSQAFVECLCFDFDIPVRVGTVLDPASTRVFDIPVRVGTVLDPASTRDFDIPVRVGTVLDGASTRDFDIPVRVGTVLDLSLIHISEPTRLA